MLQEIWVVEGDNLRSKISNAYFKKDRLNNSKNLAIDIQIKLRDIAGHYKSFYSILQVISHCISYPKNIDMINAPLTFAILFFAGRDLDLNVFAALILRDG